MCTGGAHGPILLDRPQIAAAGCVRAVRGAIEWLGGRSADTTDRTGRPSIVPSKGPFRHTPLRVYAHVYMVITTKTLPRAASTYGSLEQDSCLGHAFQGKTHCLGLTCRLQCLGRSELSRQASVAGDTRARAEHARGGSHYSSASSGRYLRLGVPAELTSEVKSMGATRRRT